jgi:hypothetical protein
LIAITGRRKTIWLTEEIDLNDFKKKFRQRPAADIGLSGDGSFFGVDDNPILK